MTAPATGLRCQRTSGIVDAILDGRDHDRGHVATCAACTVESERALRFTAGLAVAAIDATSGIPDPAVAAGTRRMGTRAGRLSLRLAALTGAVAAGLLLAAVVGLRPQLIDLAPSAFGTVAEAEASLAFLDMVCHEEAQGAICESTAPTHVHRVSLTADQAGRVVAADAVVESLDSKALDKTGADVLLARIANAVLAPDAAGTASDWIRDSMASCGPSCTAELPELDLAFESTPRSIRLTFTEP